MKNLGQYLLYTKSIIIQSIVAILSSQYRFTKSKILKLVKFKTIFEVLYVEMMMVVF